MSVNASERERTSLKRRLFVLASAILPPILTKAIWHARVRRVHGSHAWHYVGSAWRDATPSPVREGWAHDSIVEAQVAKWPEFVRLTSGTGPLGVAHEAARLTNGNYVEHNTILVFGYALALAARERPTVSVMDWGSGIGHYARFGRALLPGTSIDYHCHDLPALCEAGRGLQPDVTFHDDPVTWPERPFDLVVASGALQSIEDWQGTLMRLADATGGYLLVTRLPVVANAPSFVVSQRAHHVGYLTEFISWILNRVEFLEAAEACGLTLVREFLIQEHSEIQSAPERAVERAFLFCSQRDSSIRDTEPPRVPA